VTSSPATSEFEATSRQSGKTEGMPYDTQTSLNSAAQDLFAVPPHLATFWSGAGISGDPPTQGPLGYALTDRAIEQAFDRDVFLDRLRGAYTALGLPRDRPRLESVLDAAAAEHGIEVLDRLLADLREPPANGNHRFFAEHTRHGGHHVTANFDTCIERAGGELDRTFHIHGSFTDAGGVEALGARVGRIEAGFDNDQKAALDSLLGGTSTLIVVGYSGLDYFDVDPYWREAAARDLLRDRKVVWINHSGHWELSSGDSCQRRQLRTFADLGGAEVYQLDAPTRDVLNLVAAAWGFAPIPDPPLVEARSIPAVTLPAAARERATTRFFVMAGLRGVAGERLKGRDLDAEEHRWAAESDWAAGRYRRAAQHWTAGHSGPGTSEVVARQERQGACLWLRGQLRAARELLSQTLTYATVEGADVEQRLVVAETLGRVLVHMRRLPDTRLLVDRTSIDTALGALSETEKTITEAALGRSMSLQLLARVQSVRADLTGQPLPNHPFDGGPIRDFDESEALLPMLNYEHAQLRVRADAARRGEGGRPERWEYKRHRNRFLALGATGDAARVPLLPGAARAFPVSEVIHGLAACDFTTYHLARLTVLHLLQRARDR
jgi:hypothetical protein